MVGATKVSVWLLANFLINKGVQSSLFPAFFHLANDATVFGADEEAEFRVRVADVDDFLSGSGEGYAALAPLTLRDAAVDAIMLGTVVRLWVRMGDDEREFYIFRWERERMSGLRPRACVRACAYERAGEPMYKLL